MIYQVFADAVVPPSMTKTVDVYASFSEAAAFRGYSARMPFALRVTSRLRRVTLAREPAVIPAGAPVQPVHADADVEVRVGEKIITRIAAVKTRDTWEWLHEQGYGLPVLDCGVPFWLCVQSLVPEAARFVFTLDFETV